MKKSTITKVGITLACATLLGGIATPTTFSSLSNIVHAEETNQQPISILVAAVSAEDDTQLPFYNVTINPGETKTISAPEVEGWKLDQYTSPTYELTYDQALKTLNSVGMVWVQFWMIKDAAPTTKEPVIFTVAHRVAGGDDLLLDNGVVNPGESITLAPIAVDGYIARADNKYTYTYDEVATGSSSLFVAEIFYDKVAVDQPVEKTAEVPAEQPVETPAEQPVEKPVETPAEQPLSVTFRFVDVDGNTIYPDSVWSVAPGGTPAINDAPTVEGYELVDPSQAVMLVSYEQAKEIDTYIVEYRKVAPPTDTPVEQPAETPTEQPTEKPAEQPAETPTEKPTATSLLADNTASKTQPVATTDKKKVDNSTPSTNTVKPEEGSQTTAKTLPKTGDSSSMLLVLGGLLSGLSGLGLAATSRKRD